MSFDNEDIRIPLLVKIDNTLITTSFLKLALISYTKFTLFKKIWSLGIKIRSLIFFKNSSYTNAYSKTSRVIDTDFKKTLFDKQLLKIILTESQKGRDIYLYSRSNEFQLPKMIRKCKRIKKLFTPETPQELIDNKFYERITKELQTEKFILLTSGENDLTSYRKMNQEDCYLIEKCKKIYSYSFLKSNFFSYLSQKKFSFKPLYKEFIPYAKEEVRKNITSHTLLESFFLLWTGKANEAKITPANRTNISKPKQSDLVKEFIKLPMILILVDIISTFSFNTHNDIVIFSNKFHENENLDFQNICLGISLLIFLPSIYGGFYYATLELISTLNPTYFKITKNYIVSDITGEKLEKSSTLLIIFYTFLGIIFLASLLYFISDLFFVTLSIFTLVTIAVFFLSSSIWRTKAMLLTRINIAIYYYFLRISLTDIFTRKNTSQATTTVELPAHTIPIQIESMDLIHAVPAIDFSSLGFFC